MCVSVVPRTFQSPQLKGWHCRPIVDGLLTLMRLDFRHNHCASKCVPGHDIYGNTPQLVDFKMTFVRLYLIPADFSFLQSVIKGLVGPSGQHGPWSSNIRASGQQKRRVGRSHVFTVEDQAGYRKIILYRSFITRLVISRDKFSSSMTTADTGPPQKDCPDYGCR